MKTTHSEAQQWWSNLSNGERRLICAVARMLNGPRLCRRPAAETHNRTQRALLKELIRASAHWESSIGCFLKLRIITSQDDAPPFIFLPSIFLPLSDFPLIRVHTPRRLSGSVSIRGFNLCFLRFLLFIFLPFPSRITSHASCP